jgi:putative glutamine amidotransferase
MPHSLDLEYAERAIVQYERAITLGGGQPVRIASTEPAGVTGIIDGCHGILLPGSKADLDPARFHAPRSPHTTEIDRARETVDNLLLAHAYQHQKPVLAICYGLQSLNVYRSGSLIQHIPDFLGKEIRNRVNHEAGRAVPIAHTVDIAPDSMLAHILAGSGKSQKNSLPVNSSHHQSAENIGEDLRVVARCPDDGVIEALEGTLPNHFVLAVQWHPERSVEEDQASPSIFRALIAAARQDR